MHGLNKCTCGKEAFAIRFKDCFFAACGEEKGCGKELFASSLEELQTKWNKENPVDNPPEV